MSRNASPAAVAIGPDRSDRSMRQATTLFDRLWRSQVVRDFGDRAIIHIDRHMIHEGATAAAFAALFKAGDRVRNPELTLAVSDHIVSTMPGRTADTFEPGRELISLLERNCRAAGIDMLDVSDPRQGIVHVIAPELGVALPGVTLVCGDSHTATCGALGAYACGIGTTEVHQVLTTQALLVRRPKTMRIRFDGRIGPGVFAKDLILYLIGRFGVGAGTGMAVEYSGPAIRAMPMEGRMTICNMSIEFGARAGMIGPDRTTFDYIAGRAFAPKSAAWDKALDDWQRLPSDEDAVFDRELTVDCSAIRPQVSWGTSPQSVMAIDGRIPDPSAPPPLETRETVRDALRYMDLQPGTPIEGLPIDVAFIGSCTNGRLSDLVAAAEVVRGRRVAEGVTALVVPGSMQVRRAAEAIGLDHVFRSAGFEWRNAGCSMCVAANEDVVAPGRRCISTSNRNFENRQGPRSRTHLASPAMVAAAAIAGRITDIRRLPQPANGRAP